MKYNKMHGTVYKIPMGTLGLKENITLSSLYGRAIAQAVSRRLPTAAARVQTRVW
jgi:hypothetical protein